MNIKTSLFLAITSIKRGNKGTLAMTILIMTLAYVNLVFVSSIFGGIVEAINDEAVNNQYGNIVIEPAIDERYIENKDAIKQIKMIRGVTGVSSHYIDNPVIKYDRRSDFKDIKKGRWPLKSINPADEKKVTNIDKSVVEGSFLEATDRDQILIGKEVAGGYGGSLEHLSLGVSVGDRIDVLSMVELVKTAVLNRPYHTAPMTPSFWNARVNDIGFEKPTKTDTVRERHHSRFWRTDYLTSDGKRIYVGTASMDIGIKWGVTHNIKSDIDTERESLYQDLLDTKKIMNIEKIQLTEPKLGKNFAGDPFFTDGKAYILTIE